MPLGLFLSVAMALSAPRISIVPQNSGELKAGKMSYDFQLFDSQKKKNLTDKDLVMTHTKIMHFIVYDAAKAEFSHLHPEFKNKKWNVELNIPVSGKYFLWAQAEMKDGTEISEFVNAQVVNGQKENLQIPLGDQRKATDQMTTLVLDSQKIISGQDSMISFSIVREDGKKPSMTPYLGAFAHVIAVSPNGKELTHVHPMAGDVPNRGVIHAHFSVPGDYRLWVQLNEQGQLKTFPVSVSVFAK